MVDDPRVPFRYQFDTARDPYAARVALGAATNPVPTAQIEDGAVTAAKLADSYVLATDFPAGAWTTWSPTITSGGGTITSTTINQARYTRMGNAIVAIFDVTITNAGSGSGAFNISAPVASVSFPAGFVFGQEIGVSGNGLAGNVGSSIIAVVFYNGSSLITLNYRPAGIAIYEAA